MAATAAGILEKSEILNQRIAIANIGMSIPLHAMASAPRKPFRER